MILAELMWVMTRYYVTDALVVLEFKTADLSYLCYNLRGGMR